jgi:hypothetical protein
MLVASRADEWSLRRAWISGRFFLPHLSIDMKL